MAEKTWAEEVFVGTKDGVIKCRTVQRLPGSDKRGPGFIKATKGTAWRPVPGSGADRVPVEIKTDGRQGTTHDTDKPADQTSVLIEEDVDKAHAKRSNITDIRVAHKD